MNGLGHVSKRHALQIHRCLLGHFDDADRKVRTSIVLLPPQNKEDGLGMSLCDESPETSALAPSCNGDPLLAKPMAEIRFKPARFNVSCREAQQAVRHQLLRPSIERTCLENPLHVNSKL